MSESTTPMSPSSVYRSDVVAMIESLKPDSLVMVVATGKEDLIEEMTRRFPRLHITQIRGNEIADLSLNAKPWGLAIVANALEHMDKQSAQTVVARLRDLFSEVLLVAVPVGCEWRDLRSYWDASDLHALGLRLVNSYTYRGKSIHLYQFDINNYKTTPDWFNSRDWANPEMWDKARW